MMKRYFIVTVAAICLLAAPVFAWTPEEWSNQSVQTADATIYSGKAWFHQLIVTPDGTNAVTVTIYDNTAGSGTKILNTMVFAGDGGTQATPPVWIPAETGIYVDVTLGAGTVAYTVLYRSK